MVFLVEMVYGVLDPFQVGVCTKLFAQDGLENHSFFGTLAGGDSSVVCQPLYGDLLIEFIAAGNLGVNCIWKENHKEKAL